MILAEFLANNRTLKRLHINGNNIGNEGALQLFKALEINRTLTEITLGHNIFSRKVAKKLVKILSNKNIVSKIMVSFGGNENYDVNLNNIDPKLELLIENLGNNYIETDGITIN
jgi:Ran GTPase-activating protein (RanGAP) involved in mRNA processing and transport